MDFSILTISTFAIAIPTEAKGGQFEERHQLASLELTSDSEDKDRCFLCHELRLGPSYNCRECRLLLHKSCLEQSQTQDMNVQHNKRWKKKHHMIHTQVLDDEEKVVCSLCHKSVLGSAYRCFIPNCNFLLHPSCANLPPVFYEHPAHPQHHLYAKKPSKDARCVVCSKLCGEGLFYRCYDCEVIFDINCACYFLIEADNCWPHEFIPLPKSILQFTCQACGLEKDDVACLCKSCGLLIHGDCVKRYLGTIKVRGYRHFLTCTFSLPPDGPKYRVCNDLVDTRYAAYLCHKCGYIVHLWRANVIKELGASIELEGSGSGCGETDTASPQVIEKHASHPEHNLILCNEQPNDDQRCVGCTNQIIFPPFYGCKRCSFFLHEKCAQLPMQILQSYFDLDPLTLKMSPSFLKTFSCNACWKTGSGFRYSCDDHGDSNNYDTHCALLPEVLKHEGHQHYLLRNKRRYEECEGCGDTNEYTFRCTTCEFYLCYVCATYPPKARHRFHEHLLKLTYEAEDNSREYYCLICEKTRNSNYWFYHCIECDFTGHPQCILSYELDSAEITRKIIRKIFE